MEPQTIVCSCESVLVGLRMYVNSPQDAPHELRPLNDYVIVVLAGWRPLGRLLRRVPSHFQNTLIACGAKQLYSIRQSYSVAISWRACRATLSVDHCWALFEDHCMELFHHTPDHHPSLCAIATVYSTRYDLRS